MTDLSYSWGRITEPCPVHFLRLPKIIPSCFKFRTGQTKLVFQVATWELKHILSLIRVSPKCFDVFLVLPNTQLGVLPLHRVCPMYYIGWFGNDNVGSGVKLFESKCQLPIYQQCDAGKFLFGLSVASSIKRLILLL